MISFLYVEFHRAIVTLFRYPVNFVSSLFINVFMFYGLFMGASFLSGQSSFGNELDAMVVGYAAWVLVNRSFGRIPQSIENEAATGVLESLFLSRFSSSYLYSSRAAIDAVIDMLMIVILVVSIETLTGSTLAYTFEIIFPLITILMASIGCGMVAGGFAIRLKRISAILPTFQFVLMFLMFAPFETWGHQGVSFSSYLPMVPSVILLRDLMVNESFLDVNLTYIAVANGVFYLALGCIVFQVVVSRTRKFGTIGGY